MLLPTRAKASQSRLRQKREFPKCCLWRFGPGVKSGRTRRTVLSGTIHFGMGDTFEAGKLTAMRAGSFIVMPVGTSHFVEAREETVVQVHGVGPWGVRYVNPEDDPSKK